jgi:hypothetical protein
LGLLQSRPHALIDIKNQAACCLICAASKPRLRHPCVAAASSSAS